MCILNEDRGMFLLGPEEELVFGADRGRVTASFLVQDPVS